MEKKAASSKRFISIDVTRGLIVLIAVFVSAIPWGGYEYLHHAPWYGFTITDFLFPALLTLYGLGLGLAYKNGVKWKGVYKRSIMLVLYGLIFNFIVGWSLDLGNLRLTGVLQLFGITGLVVMLITRAVTTWKWILTVSILICGTYMLLLLSTSTGCEGGVPQTDCNLSGIIDKKVFGENHIYAQGEKGFDPEGILSIFSSISNVLMGYAVGTVISLKQNVNRRIFGIGIILFTLSFVVYPFIEFNKRLWSPSFALLTGGMTILLLALLFLFFDTRERKGRKISSFSLWYLEAVGRNSLLIYFGKMILLAIIGKLQLDFLNKEGSVASHLFGYFGSISSYPHILYAGFFFVVWSIIAMILHSKKLYFKV
ncbi:MAG: heparan-alpha-glucosaminide N-acetyltransferase domain-containing protein [Bacillota bacterium]